MLEKLRAKFKKREQVHMMIKEFTVQPSEKLGREYLCFPDGLRIILEDGEYAGFYTQNPCDLPRNEPETQE